MRSILVGLACLAAGPLFAATTTIDFEDMDYSGLICDGSISSQGFGFTIGGGCTGYVDARGLFVQTGYGSDIWYEMAPVSGHHFDLVSMQHSGPAFLLTGYYVGGGTIAETLIGDNPFGIGTIVLGPEWQNLEKVRFFFEDQGFGGGRVDTIIVNTVPIPAAVWLFGSALAGLGWARRKQAA